MEIFVYRKCTRKVETAFKAADLPALLEDDDNVVWVDMEAPTEAEEQEILAGVFNFHPLTIEDARHDHSQPKIEAFPNYIYFIAHGIRPNETNPRNFTTKELDAFLGSNFVVTYHHEKFRSIDDVKRQFLDEQMVCHRGASYLMHQILDRIVDLYAPVIDEFETYITKLEDRIFRLRRADNKVLAEIIQLKRSIMRLRRISSKQLDILYRMTHGEFEQIDEAMVPFYRDIYDHLLRISDLAETYRDLSGDLMNSYLSILANRTNDVMKTLTIFSAMMLPLTVITGIYGMNFENMPELKTRTGYFVVLGVMVLVASTMLSIFWFRGWIGNRKPSKKNEVDITDTDVHTTLKD